MFCGRQKLNRDWVEDDQHKQANVCDPQRHLAADRLERTLKGDVCEKLLGISVEKSVSHSTVLQKHAFPSQA